MHFIPPNPGNNPTNPFYYRTMEEQRRELDKQVEGSSEGDIQEEQPGITAERQKDKMFSKPKPSKRAVLDDKKDDEEKKDDEKKDDEKIGSKTINQHTPRRSFQSGRMRKKVRHEYQQRQV